MTRTKQLIRRVWQDFYLVIIMAFQYAPIVTMMVLSFNSSKSRTQWGGFTLDWYAQMFASRNIMSALHNTLLIAFLSALIATVIGTAAAIGISSMKQVPKTLLMGISANTKEEELAWEFLKLLTYDEELQTEIFRYSQGASVLKAVTQSSEMESIVQEDMEEGDTVISGKLLGRVIEEGNIEPQFKRYEQALALADSEISNILENDKTVDSSLKILQRTINNYLRQ